MTIETDPVVLKAIESMPKAQALLDNAKKVIAQRTLRLGMRPLTVRCTNRN
jgi:hypothetical protein